MHTPKFIIFAPQMPSPPPCKVLPWAAVLPRPPRSRRHCVAIKIDSESVSTNSEGYPSLTAAAAAIGGRRSGQLMARLTYISAADGGIDHNRRVLKLTVEISAVLRSSLIISLSALLQPLQELVLSAIRQGKDLNAFVVLSLFRVLFPL